MHNLAPFGAQRSTLEELSSSAIPVGDVQEMIAVGIAYPRKGRPVNAFDLPMPSDWQAAMVQAGRPLRFPDDLLAIVWPD